MVQVLQPRFKGSRQLVSVMRFFLPDQWTLAILTKTMDIVFNFLKSSQKPRGR